MSFITKKDEILKPILNGIPSWITPNGLSLLRLALCLPLLWFLMSGLYGWTLFVFGVAAMSDFLDGPLARLRNAQSDLGRFLDPAADKLLFLMPLLLLGSRVVMRPLLIAVIALEALTVLAFGAAYLAAKKLPRDRRGVLEANTFGQFKYAWYTGAVIALLLTPLSSSFSGVAHVLLSLGAGFALGNLVYVATRRP